MTENQQSQGFDPQPAVLGDFLERRSEVFEIPHYQRRYSWGKEELNYLWEDINNINGNGSDYHFFGAIVLKTTSEHSLEFNVVHVVDGQQRLTTVIIFLSCVRNLFKIKNENSSAKELERSIFHIDRKSGDPVEPKIKLGNLDQDDFENIIENDHDTIQTLNFENENISKAYESIFGKIKDLSVDELHELDKRLLDHFMLVLIRVTSQQDAYSIFEALNNRGRDLSQVDLIKNYLMKVSEEDGNTNLQDNLNTWADIIKNLNGKLLVEERFFYHFMLGAEKPRITDTFSRKNQYRKFRTNVENLSNTNLSLEEYVEYIKENSCFYSSIIDCDVNILSPNSRNDRINLHLKNLKDIGLLPARILTLRTIYELNESEISENTCRDIFKELELLMVRSLVGGTNKSQLKKFLLDTVHEIFDDTDPYESFVDRVTNKLTSDIEYSINTFKEKFAAMDWGNKNSDLVKYILSELEFHAFGSSTRPNHNSSYFVTTEHIAPKTTYNYSGIDDWKDELETNQEEFNKYRHRIGNLFLLTRDENEQAGTNKLNEKLDIYQNSNLQMANHFAESNNGNWSLEKIQSRSELLADKAAEIWGKDEELEDSTQNED